MYKYTWAVLSFVYLMKAMSLFASPCVSIALSVGAACWSKFGSSRT